MYNKEMEEFKNLLVESGSWSDENIYHCEIDKIFCNNESELDGFLEAIPYFNEVIGSMIESIYSDEMGNRVFLLEAMDLIYVNRLEERIEDDMVNFHQYSEFLVLYRKETGEIDLVAEPLNICFKEAWYTKRALEYLSDGSVIIPGSIQLADSILKQYDNNIDWVKKLKAHMEKK